MGGDGNIWEEIALNWLEWRQKVDIINKAAVTSK